MPPIERHGVVIRSSAVSLRSLAKVFMMVLLCLLPASAREMSGVWLSPDWFFPGDRTYSEAEVRRTARDLFERLDENSVSCVFLETFLRGYGVCPSISRDDRSLDASIIPYQPGTSGHPVYPHLKWPYQIEFGTVVDPLQIFIEEGQLAGIEVHAWVHLFYWRMDNNDVMLPWHNGPSLWGQLMSEYLKDQKARLSIVQGKDVRPGYEAVVESELDGDIPLEALARAAELFERGCDTVELEEMLREYDIESEGHPIGTLVSEILEAGGSRPDFLLMGSADDPFPAPRGNRLRSVYVNPENLSVRKHLRETIANIAHGHPGLSGIHLDHVRYPVDGQGLPSATGVMDGKYRYFSASSEPEMRQYRYLTQILERRQQALQSLVEDIAAELPPRMELSAAVLPLYYRDRDNGSFRTSGYDYSAQAWIDWPVDFVVPMMYEYHPYLIRTLVDKYQALANSAQPKDPIQVYPGISRLRYTRDGSVKPNGWVFFDLTLARDVKNPRQENEDLDFGGE